MSGQKLPDVLPVFILVDRQIVVCVIRIEDQLTMPGSLGHRAPMGDWDDLVLLPVKHQNRPLVLLQHRHVVEWIEDERPGDRRTSRRRLS